jgi:phosphohistidine phosphatase
MERLILFRHGKTERESASGSDFDRALVARGRVQSEAMGRLLAVSGAVPDLALVSSAVRAVQTFEAASGAFPKSRLKTTRGLYLANAAQLLAAAEAEEARIVMLVAHNPGIHELALRLAHGGYAAPRDLARLEEGFPTAAAAVFDLADGAATMKAFYTPKGGG